MKIFYNDIYDFLQVIINSEDDYIYLSIKMNRNDVPLYVGILINDSVHILKDIFLEKNISSLLLRSLENKKICLYDLKYTLKFFSEEDRCNPVLLFSKDLKIHLYNIFSKHISLDSEEVVSLTSIKTNKRKVDFIQFNSGISRNIYEVYPVKDMQAIIVDELKILKILNSKIDRYSNHIDCSNLYYRYLNKAAVAYSSIEQNKIYLSENVDYPASRRAYEDYIEKDRYASIRYDFDHSITGRISSRFHSLGKEEKNKIVSRYDRGKILSVDFSCFEIKVILDILNIKMKVDDIYYYLANEIGTERDFIKKQLISYIYGSSAVRKDIADKFEGMLNVGKYKEILKERIKGNCYNTTMGRLIEYSDVETCIKKYINGEVQSTAQLYMYDYIFIVCKLFAAKKLKSKVIYSIYDSVTIDCKDDEKDVVSYIISNAATSGLMNSDYVIFMPKLVGD